MMKRNHCFPWSVLLSEAKINAILSYPIFLGKDLASSISVPLYRRFCSAGLRTCPGCIDYNLN